MKTRHNISSMYAWYYPQTQDYVQKIGVEI